VVKLLGQDRSIFSIGKKRQARGKICAATSHIFAGVYLNYIRKVRKLLERTCYVALVRIASLGFLYFYNDIVLISQVEQSLQFVFNKCPIGRSKLDVLKLRRIPNRNQQTTHQEAYVPFLLTGFF
jgi:hypothetical protein